MQNNPICTRVEQSQLLIGLGLDTDTADFYYILRRNSEPRLALLASKVPEGMLNSIPAWSLSVLINQLPQFINADNTDYCLMMTTDRVVYWNPNKDNLFETTQDNLLDAIVETLVWLIEKALLFRIVAHHIGYNLSEIYWLTHRLFQYFYGLVQYCHIFSILLVLFLGLHFPTI